MGDFIVGVLVVSLLGLILLISGCLAGKGIADTRWEGYQKELGFSIGEQTVDGKTTHFLVINHPMTNKVMCVYEKQ